MLVTKPLIVVEDIAITTANIVYIPKKVTSVASLSFLLAFFVTFAFGLVFSIHIERRNLKLGADEKEKQMIKTEEENVEEFLITILQKPTAASLRMTARKEVISYLTSILPVMFQSQISLFKRLYIEFYRNHRYLTAKAIHEKHKFSRESDDMCRVVWAAQLLVVQAVVFLCLVLLHIEQVRIKMLVLCISVSHEPHLIIFEEISGVVSLTFYYYMCVCVCVCLL